MMRRRYDDLLSQEDLSLEQQNELEGLQFAIDQGVADSRRAIEAAVAAAKQAIVEGNLNSDQLAKTQLMIAALDKIWPKMRQTGWQESVKTTKGHYAKRIDIENRDNNIPKANHLSGAERHQRYVQGVQAAKRKYHTRSDSSEKEKPKQNSAKKLRMTPGHTKTYSSSKREQISSIQGLIKQVKEKITPINSEAATANRVQYIKEVEMSLMNNISDLTQALVFLVSEHGSIETIREQMKRMFVFTDRLKDRCNELHDIMKLQQELDRQIKSLLKQVEVLPNSVDEAIYQVNAPYLSKHPEVRRIIIDEILARAKDNGVVIPEAIFSQAKTDEEFFRMVEEVTKTLIEPKQEESGFKKSQ